MPLLVAIDVVLAHRVPGVEGEGDLLSNTPQNTPHIKARWCRYLPLYLHMLRHAAPQRVLLVALGERRARHTLLLGVCLFLGEVRDAGQLLDLPVRSESHKQRLKGY